MLSRCASDTMSDHSSGSLGRGLCNKYGSDGDVSMVFSRFVAPIDVDG